MRVIQLIDFNGEYAGLYVTNRTDNNVEKDIVKTFDEVNEQNVNDVHSEVDERLTEIGIRRVFAEEVQTAVI